MGGQICGAECCDGHHPFLFAPLLDKIPRPFLTRALSGFDHYSGTSDVDAPETNSVMKSSYLEFVDLVCIQYLPQ